MSSGRARRTLLVAITIGLLAASSVADAASFSEQLKKLLGKQQTEHKDALGLRAEPAAQGGPITLDEAVAIVRRDFPKVEVLGAVTREGEKRTVHEIKVLTRKGEVKLLRYDAATGKRLG